MSEQYSPSLEFRPKWPTVFVGPSEYEELTGKRVLPQDNLPELGRPEGFLTSLIEHSKIPLELHEVYLQFQKDPLDETMRNIFADKCEDLGFCALAARLRDPGCFQSRQIYDSPAIHERTGEWIPGKNLAFDTTILLRFKGYKVTIRIMHGPAYAFLIKEEVLVIAPREHTLLDAMR